MCRCGNMSYSTNDLVVIITGAASGIGAGAVRGFSEEGAKFIAILDIAEEPGLKLEKEINEKYPNTKAKFYKSDVTNDEELGNIFKEVHNENGRIDLVINSAGIFNDKLYDKEIKINVNGLISGSMKAFELMRKDHGGNGGTILNFSSIAGLQNITSIPVYSATKTAVLQFSVCLGKGSNYSRSGVRVLTICFGATDTTILKVDNMAAFDEESYEDLVFLINICKIQKVESAVNCVIHAFKNGASSSTWLSIDDEPPLEITDRVERAFNVLGGGA